MEQINYCTPTVQPSKKELKAEVIIENEKGHFSGGDGIKKLQIVLDKLLEISKS